MSDFRAKIIAELDLAKAQSNLSNFIAQANAEKIKLNVDLTSANKSFASLLSNMQSQSKSIGGDVGNQFVKSFTSSLNNINLKNGGIGNVKNMLKDAGFNDKSIENATRGLEKMSLTVSKITTQQAKNGNIRMTITGVDELNRGVKVINDFSSKTGEITNTSKIFTQNFASIGKEAQKAQEQLNKFNATQAKTFGNQMTSWLNKNPKAINATMKDSQLTYGQAISNLHSELEKAISAKDSDAFSRIKDQFKLIQSEAQATGNYGKVIEEVRSKVAKFNQTQAETFGNKMTAWARNNTKAVRAYGTELKNLQERLQTAILNKDGDAVKKVMQDFRLLQSEAKATGNYGKTIGESFTSALGSVTRFAASYLSVYRVFDTLKQGAQTVIELDNALVDLQKTSTATPEQLGQFYKEANEYAKQYGTTTQQMIQGAAD